LDQLRVCDRFLDDRWHLHVENCCQVIAIHDEVNPPIQDDSEVDVGIIEYVRVEPIDEEDRGVMIDV
jgi:hypothetical protein